MFDVNKIRGDFPILKRKVNGHDLVYLDSAATSQKPRQVIEAIVDYYQNHNANVARGVYTLANEATQKYEEARESVAEFIGAKTEEIIFVRNATEGLNLVAFSWGLSNLHKGDVVLTSILEHHSNILPWRMLTKERGVEVQYIDVNEEGVMKLEGKLDKRVKLVALSAKSNMTGALQPIEEIVNLVRKENKEAVVVVDGSHSVPHMATDVRKLGCDFLVFSGHKMLGPMGIGVLWGKKELLEKMPPFLRGGDMISFVTKEEEGWNDVPHKFEAGTPNVVDAVGLAAAIEYLQGVGVEEIKNYEIELTDYALEKLQKEPSVELIGPKTGKERSGIVTFNIKGVHAHDSAQVLDSFGIAVRSGQHCTGPLMERLGIAASVRASFYLYTTKEEIDYLVEKIREIPKIFRI